MSRLLIKNVNKFPEITRKEREIAILLGAYNLENVPKINELSEKSGMNRKTVEEAIEMLKEKGIVDKSLYN